jgi:2-polyprenyl-3-methyl-5-hydroxy-6-metoxy-1,4-benzoquinol methylase/ribosomal protein S27E
MSKITVNDIRPVSEINYNREVLYPEDLKEFHKRFNSQFIDVDCVACSSDRHFFITEKDGFKYRKCEKCGTAFISPRPAVEMLSWWYCNAKKQKHAAGILKKTAAKRVEIYKKRCDNMVSRVDADFNSVLELGASIGTFLQLLAERKPEARIKGIDFNDSSIEEAQKRGVEVENISIEEYAGKKSEKFDLILAFEVVEHIYEPEITVNAVYNLLEDDGCFYFTLPNFHGYDFLEIGDVYRNFAGPGHLNYFNPDSIKVFMKKVGFKSVEVYCDGVLDTNLVQKYQKEKKKIQTGFWKFIYDNSEKYSDFIDDFQSLLQKHKLSGNMTVVAKK